MTPKGEYTLWQRLRVNTLLTGIILATLFVAGLTLWLTLRSAYFGGFVLPGENGRADYISASGMHITGVTVSGSDSEASCDAPSLSLTAEDAVREPDTLPSYASLRTFFERQSQLSCLQKAQSLTFSGLDADGLSQSLTAERTGWSPAFFPIDYWIAFATGVGGLLIGGWVWAMRPRELATQLLALAGVGLAMACMSNCVYGMRPLALSGELFRGLTIINHVGSHLFGLAMVLLFMVYPARIVNRVLLWGTVAAGVAIILLDVFWLLWAPAANYPINLVETLMMLALIAIQWWRARTHPRARAATLWFALSVFIGIGTWCAVAMAYYIQGRMQEFPQSLVLGAFLIFFLGVALGVARFRLFELGDWAFRLFFFTIGAVLFIVLDAVLVLMVGIGGAEAMGLSLLVVAFGYLPARDFLWRRFFSVRKLSENEMFKEVLEVVFAPTPLERSQRWRGLLNGIFEPLHIDVSDRDGPEAQIEEDGLRLEIPAVADTPALSLRHARSGRALFSPANLGLVKQLIVLIRTASQSRDAYERGAAETRRRLAQDLHDDVGARLLSGLVVADDRVRPILQEALGDIRSIAHGMLSDHVPVAQLMADLRHETVRRLEAARIEVIWPLLPEDAPLVLMDYPHQKALSSALREAVSNVIKHAGATKVMVTVVISDRSLSLTVHDDGKGVPDAVLSGEGEGEGFKGLYRRMADIGGRVHVSRDNGTRIVFDMPFTS